jgi:hypothetical protein
MCSILTDDRFLKLTGESRKAKLSDVWYLSRNCAVSVFRKYFMGLYLNVIRNKGEFMSNENE